MQRTRDSEAPAVFGTLKQLLGAYLPGMPVETRPLGLHLDVLDGDVCVVDERGGAAFPVPDLAPTRKGAGKGKRVSAAVLDVFALLHVLEEFVRDHDFALVALVDARVAEPDQPDVPILGRACGDRVCVVSTMDASPRELCVTAVHVRV